MHKTTSLRRDPWLRRAALRLAVGVVAFLALGGPSPGYIGGCDAGGGTPDARQFCIDRTSYTCAREFTSGRLSEADFTLMCNDGAIAGACASVSSWNPPCIPTRNQTQRCIMALQDTTRFDTPSPLLPECNDLCGGAPLIVGDGI